MRKTSSVPLFPHSPHSHSHSSTPSLSQTSLPLFLTLNIPLLYIYFILLGESEDANTLDETYRNAPYNDLVRTPRPLRNEDFMGDIIVQVIYIASSTYSI